VFISHKIHIALVQRTQG